MTTSKAGKSGGRTTGATVSLVITTPTLTDSANGFTQADVGMLVTGTNIPAATTITAVSANGNTATMSANATATSGPQTVTTSPNYVALTLDSVGCCTAVTYAGLTPGPGQVHQMIQAANEWHNVAGAGEHGLMANKRAAAQGLVLIDN